MTLTFGIVTDGQQWDRVYEIMRSIYNQNIPEFEIIVIGGKLYNIDQEFMFCEKDDMWFKHIPFNESQTEKGWITRKKNIIAKHAKYDNLVLLHDYFTFDDGWFDGWVEFGEDWDVAVNCIQTLEGYRHSDWVIDPFLLYELYPHLHWKFWDVALPYDIDNLTKLQYISGGFFLVKKTFLLEHNFKESLFWGDAEDIEWSQRIRQVTTFKINTNSLVTIMKPGKWAPGLIPETYLQTLKEKHGL